jgi:hypothetical protein
MAHGRWGIVNNQHWSANDQQGKLMVANKGSNILKKFTWKSRSKSSEWQLNAAKIVAG